MRRVISIVGLIMALGAGSLLAQDIALTGTTKVGTAPRGIAVTPDGTKCYVPDINTGDIYILDNATSSVRSIVNVGGGRGARNPVLSPDGRFVIVLAPPDAVVVIDTTTDTIVSRIYIPIPPANIAFTNDGGTMLMYILTAGSYNYLTKVDTTSFTIVSQIEMPKTILYNGFVVTKDGRYALATTAWSEDPIDYLTVVEIATMQVVAKVPVGMLPVSVAMNGDGTKAYVANYNSSSMTVVDLVGFSVMRELVMPGKPYRVRGDAAGRSVWAICDNLDALAVVDTAADALAATVASPGIATPKNDIVFRADKRLAVATASDTGTINLVDVTKAAMVKSIGSGGRVTDLAMTAKGDAVYVVDELTGAVVACAVTGGIDTLAEAIGSVIETLNGLVQGGSLTDAQKATLVKSLATLEGNNGGKADNGAIDKLLAGDLVAALVKIRQAILLLEDAERMGVDTVEIQRLLAECAGGEVERLIVQTESESGATSASTQARTMLASGRDYLSTGNEVRAVEMFKKAAELLR